MKTNEIRRDAYFDFLRGISIIFVVGIHTINENFDYYSIKGFSMVFLRQIISCAVPIFLAISGYFLVKKTINTQKDYFAFLKKQIPTVYIPCLLWSIPYLVFSLKGGDSVLFSFLKFFCCAFSVFYFIAAIIQCYILLPIVKNISFILVLLLLFISLIWTLLNTRYNLICGNIYPLIVYAAPFPNLLVFFSLGCWLGEKEREYSLKIISLLLFIALILSNIETFYLNSRFEVSGLGMKTSVHIYDFLIILFLFHPTIKNLYKNNIITSIICRLGTVSFAIYLSHLLIWIYLTKIVYIPNHWIVIWIVLLLVSWFCIEILRLVIPHKLWKHLGLR